MKYTQTAYNLNGNDGLCILVESAASPGNRVLRHNRTKTYMTNLSPSQREEYYILSPKAALDFDINDLRNIYKNDGIYDVSVENALQDLIKKTKIKYKPLFD